MYFNFKQRAEQAFQFFINLIFPVECLSCGREGKWICADCRQKIVINEKNCCLSCKMPTVYGEFCARCRGRYNLDGVLIAGDYNSELLRRAIKSFKYRLAYEIGRELSEFLILFLEKRKEQSHALAWLGGAFAGQNNLPPILKGKEDIVVMPMPLHPRRERWRGFNQAAILGRAVADYCRLEFNDKSLRRIKRTREQASLKEAERRLNVADSFSWRGGNLDGKDIVIVDDVATTGATLESCAQVLKEAGAKTVWGLVVAKG